jgi:DNA modification methylase
MRLELNKIYCMDCLEGLKQIDDNSIDLVLTDPHYAMGKEFEMGLKLDNIIPQYTKLTHQKAKEDSWFIYTCPCKTIDYFIEKTKEVGYKFERILFYYKKSKFTDVWCGWLLKSEAILLFSKGNPNKSNSNKPRYNHDVYTVQCPTTNDPSFIEHQSAKNLKVWTHIITSLSKQGDTVLDPFMGSGTTAVACKQLQRNFIGFELSQKYVDIANKRLQQDTLFSYDVLQTECE